MTFKLPITILSFLFSTTLSPSFKILYRVEIPSSPKGLSEKISIWSIRIDNNLDKWEKKGGVSFI